MGRELPLRFRKEGGEGFVAVVVGGAQLQLPVQYTALYSVSLYRTKNCMDSV